jgi:phosphatidylserine decarboxylase
MHSMKGETYGWEHPVFLGRFPVSPGATGTSGPDFWRDHRIDPLLRATWSALGGLGPRVENLLRQYSPSTEGPTLLHGDLWNGNVVMARGGATLIDPSVWWGERAVDLAMMQLFGGFSQRFWSHYDSLLPMGPSVHETIPFYQLYFLLVHVHFFGRGYCSGVERILDTYGV